jgi:hypothetical protein
MSQDRSERLREATRLRASDLPSDLQRVNFREKQGFVSVYVANARDQGLIKQR